MLRNATLLLAATALTCFGQSADTTDKHSAPNATSEVRKFYQLSFVVRELEGDRVLNSRSYSMVMSAGNERSSSIRAGEKVPFATGSPSAPEWQQIHVGVNIDCSRARDLGDRIALRIGAEISSVPESRSENTPPPSQPIIRQNQWDSDVVIPLRQPTVIYSSDDPLSKHKMQLQVTVVPVQ